MCVYIYVCMYVYTTASLSIQLYVDIYDCFHTLAIVNSAAMNIGVHVSFRIRVFSGYTPRSGIAASHGSSIFSFEGTSIEFFIVAVSIRIPINSVGGFLFIHTLSSIYCLYTF